MLQFVVPRRLPPAAQHTGAAVRIFGLDEMGVKTIGMVPAGLLPLRMPSFPPALLPGLCAEAAGVALIAFSSMMLTAVVSPPRTATRSMSTVSSQLWERRTSLPPSRFLAQPPHVRLRLDEVTGGRGVDP